MDLRFSPEENAFRQELRSFFRSKVPEIIRKKVSENRHLSKEEMITSHRCCMPRDSRFHTGQGVGRADWTPRPALLYTRSCSSTRTPAAAVQCQHVRTGGHRLRHRPSRRSAYCRMRRWDDGGARASPARCRLRSGRPQNTAGARATITSSMARSLEPRWRNMPTGSSASARTDPAARSSLGISFLLIDMKEAGITVRPIQTWTADAR